MEPIACTVLVESGRLGTLSIRRATTSDIEALAGLLAYIDDLHQSHDRRQIRQGQPQRANHEQLTKGIVDPATLVLVRERGGSLVGYARMEIRNTTSAFCAADLQLV